MYIPKKRKRGHALTQVSRKAVNRFIHCGLRIMAAKPALYFHQILSFPKPIYETKVAKAIFNKFMKGVSKYYRDSELAVLHIQERRNDGTIHFHLCFVFFSAEKMPYSPSRMHRDFRTDIYKRWNGLNNLKLVHVANQLKQHEFDLETLRYFCRAVEVPETGTKRPESNWWGLWNKKLVLKHSSPPSMKQTKAAFNEFFKKLPFVNNWEI